MTNATAATASKGRDPWNAAIISVLVGFLYGLFGFFVMSASHGAMGGGLFIFLPVVVGATLAVLTPRPFKGVVILSGGIALLLCLLSLISLKLEGLLCALLAFPIIFVSLMIGVGVGIIIRNLVRPSGSVGSNCFILLTVPALIFGGHRVEVKNFGQPRTQSVTTTIHLEAKPEQVWANIQSLDKLEGKKPILMYVGLPIPQRCVLKGTAVGSKRICYFDQGFIEETILEWDPPHGMRLSIDRTNMPGRHWLSFEGAEYDLQPDATGTTITRTTTIRSNLSPAWYWAPFENYGVASEHTYLLRDLALRFPSQTSP
jgi:hypothetical protein